MKALEIFEARSNPNLNPRMTATDVLSIYGGQRDVYIHFTDTDKIGINPNPDPRYPNPYGVYSYPIEELKRATGDFSKPVYDSLYAGYMKNIFVFKYDSRRPLYLRSTNIPEREFEAVRDYFISKSNGTHMDEINGAFRGKINSGADLWKIVFKLIELLGVPSSNTSFIVFKKVLGYDMIVDDGLGMMYGSGKSNLRVQVVHLDTNRINVVEILDNKPAEPKDRVAGREEYAEYQKKKDEESKGKMIDDLTKLALQGASVPVMNGHYPNYMNAFSRIMRSIGSGEDAVMLSRKFYEGIISFADEISRKGDVPTDRELQQITDSILVTHHLTKLDGDFIDDMTVTDGDMVFDIRLDLIDQYANGARKALSELRNMK